MYSVSDSYKKALLGKHITDTVTGSVVLKDGTSIELSDKNIVTGSLRISHELCDDYKIGTFNLGSLNIGFFDDNALGRDFSGAKITITYKIETDAGWESVPMGIFIADGQSVVRRRNTVTLTAYDYGILFDCTIGTTIRNMSGYAENIISAACERCGVVFGGIADGLPNTRITLSPSSERIQSCRDLVGWCAALLCGYAVIDRTGKLFIISARYDVDAEDPTEIIVDKLLTEAERNSIYSTDTRAWIAQMSGYSDGKTKIYKSNITREDSQAARAVYYLENNPLTEGMGESLCDLINCNWLGFIDGFMQRGITAEIYGDPALDTGDIIRCSGGDIDQRRSVVGLVTKQEWRYRDYHTVICASAQLGDGIEAPQGEESENSQAQAVGDTDDIYPVKVISQSEKRGTGGGQYYLAGDGLALNENVFSLVKAGRTTIGGIRLSPFATVPDDDTTDDRDCGIYVRGIDAFPSVRRATKKQIGGLYLGDGLAPTVEQSGETYTNTGHVEVRIGEALEFIENDEATEDVKEKRQNNLGGRAVAVTRATREKFGSVKLGKRIGVDAEGAIYSVMSGKDGIEVSDNGEISVLVDEETITVNGEGKLVSMGGGGVAVENAVIISEADSKLLIHEYTEVEYIAGNKIGYAGPSNQIILQGFITNFGNNAAAAVSGIRYTGGKVNVVSGSTTVEKEITFEIYSATPASTTYRVLVNGSIASSFTTFNPELMCFVIQWESINGTKSTAAPYGYATVSFYALVQNNTGTITANAINGLSRINIPFISEAEYNAAIGLTYEPLSLTEVQETVTEV
ncbi:MAG: hypothetical protein IKK53_04360 [Ruminiclostridium sp.]|nr:hypothetical protein [Ruminiclostridium sp.]